MSQAKKSVILRYVCTQNPNRSGSTSIVIVDKSTGNVRYLKTIGVSSDPKEIDRLYLEGKRCLSVHLGHRDMFTLAEREREEKQVTEYLLNNVENILLNGTQLLFNELFRLVGLDVIDDDILKHLVIARLCQPSSKVGTVDYLKSYFGTSQDLPLFRPSAQQLTGYDSSNQCRAHSSYFRRTHRACI